MDRNQDFLLWTGDGWFLGLRRQQERIFVARKIVERAKRERIFFVIMCFFNSEEFFVKFAILLRTFIWSAVGNQVIKFQCRSIRLCPLRSQPLVKIGIFHPPYCNLTTSDSIICRSLFSQTIKLNFLSSHSFQINHVIHNALDVDSAQRPFLWQQGWKVVCWNTKLNFIIRFLLRFKIVLYFYRAQLSSTRSSSSSSFPKDMASPST